MRSKCLAVVLVLSLAVNAGVLATVGYHYYLGTPASRMKPCPVSPGDSHLYRSLDLSDLQLSKMEPLAKSFHDRLDELGATMEKKKELLIDLLEKDSDPATIDKLRKEMAAIQDEIQNEVIIHITEIRRILDPEQQQLLFDLMRRSMVHKSLSSSSWGNS